jgi:drug/metabolite transporter (DMT)-like permease
VFKIIKKVPKTELCSENTLGDRRANLDGWAIAVVTACCMIWGYQQIAIKAIADEVPFLMQLTIRSVIASGCIWAWMAFKKIKPFQRDRTLIPGMAAGLLFFSEFVLLYSALEYTHTSRAITFLYLAPFIVALVLPLFIPAERLSWIQSAGLAVAFGGILFAFQDGFWGEAKHYFLGDLAVIGAAIAWAFTTIVVRITTLSQIQPERTIFFQLFFSSLALIALCLFFGIPLPTSLSGKAIASLFLQSVIIAAISYLFWFWLLRHYLATKVSAFSFLTPMFGLIFGFLFAGEPIDGKLILAFICIALGIYLVNRQQRK